MKDTKEIDTLIVKKDIIVYSDLSYFTDLSTVTWYDQSVRSLIYVITEIRFDIVFVIFISNQFLNNSEPKYVVIVKYIFQYLRKYHSFESNIKWENFYYYIVTLTYTKQ